MFLQLMCVNFHLVIVCILLAKCKWHMFCPTLAIHATRPTTYFYHLLVFLLLARRSMSEALMLQALPVWRGPSVCHHM